ncbi:MAG: hypothetical protein ABSB74_13920 [Tepidisphaeraceae bacterium]
MIFSLPTRGTHPGLGAKDVRPERHGEGYLYIIDKFWVVAQTRDKQVVVKTRKGRIHLLDTADPRLHVASWWQRLIYRHRFPKPEPCTP